MSDYDIEVWMRYFNTLQHKFRAAIQDDRYLSSKGDFLRELTKQYITEDNIRKKIRIKIDYLRNEIQHLENDYDRRSRERLSEYYMMVSTDYEKWKQTTERD